MGKGIICTALASPPGRRHRVSWGRATAKERLYLPVARERIGHGSLAGLVREQFERDGVVVPILADPARAL
ncbi:MAG: hypothetical protein WCB46_05325 [Methanoregula sp.]